jgi:phosphoribosylformimino-5-aminoimidazole carboxamide ribotide isomerase
MVDSGISDLNQAKRLLSSNVSKLIIGTETLSNLNFVKLAIENFGSDKIVVSLDLMEGKVLSQGELICSISVKNLASKLEGMGVCELIVLDLARVGSGEGLDFSLLKQLVNNLKTKLFVGGGVRDLKDLMKLKRIGVHGVLLATALHSGAIPIEKLVSEFSV